MERVDIRNIEFNDDYTFSHLGRPFTGIGFELAASGQVISETGFVDGVQQGLACEWYLSGAKRAEKHYRFGSLDGVGMEWFESGKVKRRTIHELGVCIESDEWDEKGNLISNYRMAETDPNFNTLQLLRNTKWEG